MAFNAGSIEATLTLNRNPFTEGLRAARKQAQDFTKNKIEAAIKAKLDDASLQAVKAKLDKVKASINVKVKLDAASLTALKERVNAATGSITVKVKLDNATLNAIKQRINAAVGTISVRAKLDNASLIAIRDRINAAVGTISVRAKLDNASLTAIRDRINAAVGTINVKAKLDNESLAAIRARLAAVSATVRVAIDRAAFDRLVRDLKEFGRSVYVARARVNVDDAAFRDLVNRLRIFGASSTSHNVNVNTSGAIGGVQALLTLLPLLLPVGASAIVGLTGLLGGLTSALGVAAIGVGAFGLVAASVFKTINESANAIRGESAAATAALSAVKTARSALSSAMESAATADKQAAKRVADAYRDVQDAVEQAGQANARAARAVEDAERNLTSAQQTAKRAQEDLNQARKDAVEELEDLKLSLRGAGLSEEQAMIDLEEAQIRYNKALKDGTSGLELKQLELNVRKAKLSVDESKESFGDLKEKSDEFAKSGIEGSKGVRDAQRGVQSAADGVADAQRGVKDATDAANQTAKDGARSIQDAEEKLKEARDQATLTHLKGQKDIAEARTKLAEAEKKYTTEMQGGQKALTAAMIKSRDALIALKDEYDALVKRTEVPVNDALVAMFKAAQQFLKTIDPLVTKTAEAFTIIGGQIEKYFAGPVWKDFVNFLSNNIIPNMTRFFEIIAYATQGVFNLIKAFDPLADFILDGMVQGMKNFASWTAKLGEDAGFKNFVRIAMESLPKIVDFISSVVKFLWNLSVALAPFGDVILTVLTQVFDGLSKLPPEWLAAIGEGLAVVFTALLLGASGPVALVAGVIVGIAAALAYLYSSNEDVRKTIDGMVTVLRDKFAPIWKTISDNFKQKILPAWDSLVDITKKKLLPVLQELGDKFVKDIFPVLKDLAETITGKLAPAFITFLEDIEPFTTWLTETIGTEAIASFKALIQIIDGALKVISGIFKIFGSLVSGDWDTFFDGLNDIAEGVLTAIGALFGLSFDDMKKMAADFERNMDNWWADFWGGIKTEQDGSQTEVKGSWNQFWEDSAKNFDDQLVKPVSKGWVDFWGGVKTEQNGSQTQVSGAWNDFWAQSAKNFQDQLVTPVSNGWVNFWGGVKTEQNGSQTTVNGAWNDFWDGIRNRYNTWSADISKNWNDFWNSFSKVATDFSNTIGNAWNEFWTGVGKKADEIWAAMQITTQIAVTNIGNAFRKIGNFFRDPINWVIDVVINRGIIDSWNTVMGWIGQPALAATKLNQLPAFAEGGQIVGPGHGTSDSILARVSNGEYIMPAKRAKRHAHFLEALRQGQPEAIQAAGGGNNADPYPRYAAGGMVNAGLDFARKQQGKPYIWGGVGPNGYDCSGFMSAITNTLLGRAPYSRVGTTGSAPWPGFSGGLNSEFGIGYFKGNPGHMAGTLGGVNVESGSGHGPETGGRALGALAGMFTGKMSLPQAGGVFTGGGGGGGAAAPVSFWSLLGEKVTNLFAGVAKTAGMPGAGAIGNAMKRIPPALMAKVTEAAKQKLLNLFTAAPVGMRDAGSLGAAVTGGVKEKVNAVAATRGWGQGSTQWAPLSDLIQRESSWNPTAQNPTSTAYGLFQFLNSTWATVGGSKTSDPSLQAKYGLQYIANRYKTPAGAIAFHNSKGWYDQGGEMPRGPATFTKGNVGPERVLSPRETNDFARLVAILEQLVGEGGSLRGSGSAGDVPAIGNLYVTTGPRASASEIIEEATFAAKKARRQGVHQR